MSPIHGRWVPASENLASLVETGDVIGPSGFHFVRSPVALLRSVLASGVKDLTYVAWGGGLPLEMLLDAGAVRKIIFCFSSLDVFGLAPRFRRALEAGTVEVEERSALGYVKGLRAGMEQLPYELMQYPRESDLSAGFCHAMPGAAEAAPHADVAAVAPLALDAFLLHAQRADDAGNVEIDGARGLDVLTAFTSRRVLVTVEERVPNGTLGAPGSFILPRDAVTALCVRPGGAWPTSCLPAYPADLHAIQRVAASPDLPVTKVLAAVEDRNLVHLREVADVATETLTASVRSRPRRVADSVPEQPVAAASIDELMISAIAHTVTNESICSIGSVSPLATIAYLLAKRLWAPDVAILSHNGGYIDIAARPMTLITAELLDYRSAAAFVGSDDTYHWYYQRGRISHEVVSAAQVDRRARTNTSWIRRSDGRLRLPGQGGMADVADMHQRFFIYLPRHSPRSTVSDVDFVSAARSLHHDTERVRHGYRSGPTTLLTNLGMFEYDANLGELMLTHMHPGVALQDVERATGWRLRYADRLATTPVPSAEELRIIREELDPLGVRRLEFVPSAERDALITLLLADEESAISAALDTMSSRGG